MFRNQPLSWIPWHSSIKISSSPTIVVLENCHGTEWGPFSEISLSPTSILKSGKPWLPSYNLPIILFVCFGTIPSDGRSVVTQELLAELGNQGMLKIQLRLASCKGNTLPSVLALWASPHITSLKLFSFKILKYAKILHQGKIKTITEEGVVRRILKNSFCFFKRSRQGDTGFACARS